MGPCRRWLRIVGGIVTLTILFTRLAPFLQTVRGKRVKGLSQLDVRGHVVIIGYLAGRTERMVGELSVERAHPLVLCAWDEVTENPMAEPAHVQFVRGDPTSTDVMTRACVARAVGNVGSALITYERHELGDPSRRGA